MKKIFSFLISLLVICGLNAQNETAEVKSGKLSWLKPTPKMMNAANKFSVTATIGTDGLNPNALNINDLQSINPGEFSINYKMSSRIHFGLATFGRLENIHSGYTNAEGEFLDFPEHEWFDDDDDEHDDDDDMDDDDDDEHEDEGDHDDDDDFEDDFGDNLMGVVTYVLSEKYPFFLQGAAGFSFRDNAPGYSAKIGYSQKVFAGFGVTAGVRFSDVLQKLPADGVSMNNSAAVKAELGLNWNF